MLYKMELRLEIPILVLRERNRDSNFGFERKKIDYDVFGFYGWWSPYFCARQSPWIQGVSRFDLVAERLGKSSGIFLSWISKNFEELGERKFVEGRIGL